MRSIYVISAISSVAYLIATNQPTQSITFGAPRPTPPTRRPPPKAVFSSPSRPAELKIEHMNQDRVWIVGFLVEAADAGASRSAEF
jgi:hypothetical protein